MWDCTTTTFVLLDCDFTFTFQDFVNSGGLRVVVCEWWSASGGLRVVVLESWFESGGLRTSQSFPDATSWMIWL